MVVLRPADCCGSVLGRPARKNRAGGEGVVGLGLGVGQRREWIHLRPCGKDQAIFAEPFFGDAKSAEMIDDTFKVSGREAIEKCQQRAVAFVGIFAADDGLKPRQSFRRGCGGGCLTLAAGGCLR